MSLLNYSAVIKYKPLYPVVHSHPGFGLVVNNFNARDYQILTAATLGSAPIGFFLGRVNRRASMFAYSLLGLTFGFIYNYQSSAARLMGYRSNESLVKKYPFRLDTPTPVPTDVFREPTAEDIERNKQEPNY